MNKQLLLLLLVLLSATASFGQLNRLEVALEGGPSLVSLRGNDVISNYSQPEIGFSGGASLQYNISGLLAIRTGIAFERKGAKTEHQGSTNTGSAVEHVSHYQHNYITLPLLARVSFGDSYKLFASAGPFIGYLLSQKTVLEATSEHPEQIMDNTADTKRFDTGISLGVGTGIPINSNMLLTLEVRNNLGLYNVSKVSVVNDGTVKTNSTNLLLGISFKF